MEDIFLLEAAARTSLDWPLARTPAPYRPETLTLFPRMRAMGQ